MEDIKKIQEFFSKPLNEDTFKVGQKVTYLGHPAVVTATKEYNGRNFVSVSYDKGTGKTKASDILTTSGDIKPLNENVHVEAFKLGKALKGMGYDVKVKAVDDFGKNVFEIYFNNPADADDDSIFYDVKKLGYDNVRVFANPQESVEEVTRYSGFNRNPEDPDSEPFNPTGAVAEFKEDLRALFGKFKGDLKNPEFIKGVGEIMVSWKSLLRSQLGEAKEKAKENTKKLTKEDVRNLVVGTIAEIQNKSTLLEGDDRCTRIAKSKYDTWPSAYASGAVVRCRRGEIWKDLKEDLTSEAKASCCGRCGRAHIPENQGGQGCKEPYLSKNSPQHCKNK